MRFKHKFLTFLIVTIGTLLLISYLLKVVPYTENSRNFSSEVVLANAVQFDSKLPKKLYPCLPKQVRKLKFLAHTTANKNSYYLIGVYNLPSQSSSETEPVPDYQQTLVSLNEIGCLVIIPKDKLGAVSLTEYVPEQAARNLKLQAFRQAIAEVSKEKFQKVLLEDESLEGDKSYFFPEDAWALQQLGVQLPPNTQIVKDFESLDSN